MEDLFGKATAGVGGGCSYFSKYLMGCGGCISPCVFSGNLCVSISVSIRGGFLRKGALNEGEDDFPHFALEESNFLLLCITLSISSYYLAFFLSQPLHLPIYPLLQNK